MATRSGRKRSPAWATPHVWWRWIFCLGFAAANVPREHAPVTRRALISLGPVLPWILVPAVLIWSEVYQLSFWGMLAILELQSLVVAGVIAAFAPRRSLGLVREVAVNTFVAMVVIFLWLLALSFAFGFLLLVLAEG
jgi:hypothetical protein